MQALAVKTAGAIGGSFRVTDFEMHIVKLERCSGGDANGPVQGEFHLPESHFALDEEFAVMTKFSGTAEDDSIMEWGQRLLGYCDSRATASMPARIRRAKAS